MLIRDCLLNSPLTISFYKLPRRDWIPACAGMTKWRGNDNAVSFAMLCESPL